MAKDPFVVDLAEVLRRPGAQHPLHLEGLLPGVELSTARVPGDGVVTLDATVEAQGHTVIVQGTARAVWEGECRRCLEHAAGDLELDLREVFEPHPVEGETFPITDERIDVGAVLRELLALALPLAPLCSDDCPGPDPEAHPVTTADEVEGADGVDDAAGGEEPPGDPRWAALRELRFDA
ncbi:MAG TPA: DUF177 domain-containing protein [Acidimicrobiales bacterium]